jgi:hypothetical protein
VVKAGDRITAAGSLTDEMLNLARRGERCCDRSREPSKTLVRRGRVAGVEDWIISDVRCRHLASDTHARPTNSIKPDG